MKIFRTSTGFEPVTSRCRCDGFKLSHCVNQVMLNVGNDECIILYNFGGRIMSGFEVKDGGHPKPPPPGCRKQKKKQRCQTNIETFNIEVQHTGILPSKN